MWCGISLHRLIVMRRTSGLLRDAGNRRRHVQLRQWTGIKTAFMNENKGCPSCWARGELEGRALRMRLYFFFAANPESELPIHHFWQARPCPSLASVPNKDPPTSVHVTLRLPYHVNQMPEASKPQGVDGMPDWLRPFCSWPIGGPSFRCEPAKEE